MDFEVNQTFVDSYPPEVAEWCNNNNCLLEKTVENGLKKYRITAVEIPETTLSQAKAAKLKEINQACDIAVDALLADYPESEKSSFEQQYREAVKYQESSNPSDAPLLSLLSDARGISLDSMCSKVIEKRNAYTLLCGNALAQKQQLVEKLGRLRTVRTVESLDTAITIGDMK